MSKRSDTVAAEECIALGAVQRQLDPYPNREVNLGALAVARALPIKDRRLVGPWCVLDRFGPLTFDEGRPMDVAPHTHIGLQTGTSLQSRLDEQPTNAGTEEYDIDRILADSFPASDPPPWTSASRRRLRRIAEQRRRKDGSR